MVFFNKLFLIDDPNFWKLDKIDKIVIVLILLIGCVCVCFASESENVYYTVLSGIGFNNESETFYSSSSSVAYFPIEPGYTYTINNRHGYNIYVGSSPEIPTVGGSVSYVSTIGGLQQYSFTASSIKYAFINTYVGDSSLIVTRTPLEGMDGAVDNLSYYAGYNIWESFTNSLPFVLPLVLVCFGMYIISHFVNKNSKGV